MSATPTRTEEVAPRGGARRALGLLRPLVAGALIAWVASRIDPGAAWAELSRPEVRWVYPAVLGLFLLNTLIYAGRVVALFPAPRPPLLQIARASLLGNFAGLALPSGGGEAIKVVAMARWTDGPERALAAVVGARALELVIWGLLVVWAAVAVLPGALPAAVGPAWLAAAGLAGIGLLAASGLRWGDRWARWIPGRPGALLQRATSRAKTLGADPARIGLSLALVLPFAAINCGAVWLILQAYGAAVDYPALLGLIPAIDVLIALPITIAGLGVRENLFVYALGPWGVSGQVAVAAALTRWSGDLGRAALGGILFALGRAGTAQEAA